MATAKQGDGGHTNKPTVGGSDTQDDTQADKDVAAIQALLQHFMAQREQQIEQAKQTLAVEVLPALLASGITNIEVAYSGYGDSGAIDGVQFRDAQGMRVVRGNIPETLREKLESCVYAFLPTGFEVNDGGQGSVVIDLPSRKITLRHEQNETVTHDTTQQWEV